MGIKERKKEKIKEKIISFVALLFLSLYLFDKGQVNDIKNGVLLFFMSSALFALLKINNFYIQTGKKISLDNKNIYMMFKLGDSKTENYNTILSIMMLLAWLISLCLVLFGSYLYIKEFVAV